MAGYRLFLANSLYIGFDNFFKIKFISIMILSLHANHARHENGDCTVEDPSTHTERHSQATNISMNSSNY